MELLTFLDICIMGVSENGFCVGYDLLTDREEEGDEQEKKAEAENDV